MTRPPSGPADDGRSSRRPGSGATIAGLRVHSVRVGLRRPFVTAVRTATDLDVTLVEAQDSEGRSGWGEAACSWRVTGESPASVREVVEQVLAPAVTGMPAADPSAVAGAVSGAVAFNSAARSAVVCAAYDLAAQDAGLPLASYLRGDAAPPPSVRTDMTLSAGPTDELVRRALDHVAEGFRTLKVKVGGGFDDVGALPAVRAAVGREIGLRADANQGWDCRQAISVITAWEGAGVELEFVEQPVRAAAFDDLATVTAAVRTRVLADESVWDLDDVRRIVAGRAASLINIKLAKCGGIAHALDMAAVAAEAGVGVIIGCMMESTVGIAAAAAVAGALPHSAGLVHDLDAGAWQRTQPTVGGVRYQGGILVPSSAPGLGIRLASGPTPIR